VSGFVYCLWLHECLEACVPLFLAVLHRCSWGHLLNAKGDSLDQMWPSGSHLTFGLLALLAVIEFLKADRDECTSSVS
jgi:hypothetical protein